MHGGDVDLSGTTSDCLHHHRATAAILREVKWVIADDLYRTFDRECNFALDKWARGGATVCSSGINGVGPFVFLRAMQKVLGVSI